MRILFFTDHFYPEMSAPAAHIYERARLWTRAGHEVTVITNAPNTPRGQVYDGYRNVWRFIEELDSIRIVRVKTYVAPNEGTFRRVLDYLSYTVSSLVHSFLERRPDIVISSSPHLFVPVAGVIAARRFGVPHVFELRDLWPASITAAAGLDRGPVYRLLERLELWLYRQSERILAFTPAYIDDLTERGVPRHKLDLVLSGANLELFSPRPADLALVRSLGTEDRFVVGYMGTIGLAHGLENVIAAARSLRGRPVTFLFVGEGAEKARLMEMVQAENLSNVLFISRKPREEIPRYWSVCSAALVHLKDDPVFRTVIPSKIFEAMAMGLPIVYVGPGGEGSRIVEGESAGIVVPSANPDRLAEAVERLLDDPELLGRSARNSAAAAEKYSRNAQAERTLDSLARALGQGH